MQTDPRSKLQRIVAVRRKLGLGLREAKEFVEAGRDLDAGGILELMPDLPQPDILPSVGPDEIPTLTILRDLAVAHGQMLAHLCTFNDEDFLWNAALEHVLGPRPSGEWTSSNRHLLMAAAYEFDDLLDRNVGRPPDTKWALYSPEGTALLVMPREATDSLSPDKWAGCAWDCIANWITNVWGGLADSVHVPHYFEED